MRSGLGWAGVFATVSLLLLAVSAHAQRGKKGKDKAKTPDLEVVELTIQREDRVITVDGRVRNISAKPLKGLVLFFEFLESDGKMISRMIAEVTKGPIPPGGEGEFETQTKDQSRAGAVRVDAEDNDGRYFTLDRPGPHEIE